ncbi:cell wall hydrolase [Sphingomonas sp. KRR8]|uniref:cell wall hydrolase n=1 Tax=Sphingomonas sp. KRR8 TaxID=2942996 RepID=UPI0020206AA2|nr:cell wall hydrolase [Sphingomonas sp. KRR8]URD60212.1 cell wall hydrolase [Sphingomonas sp. KRR8]
MLHRFAMMIAGMALAAGSVAPAQVVPVAASATASVTPTDAVAKTSNPSSLLQPGEPLIAAPVVAAPEAPTPLDTAQPSVDRSESLTDKVAELRSANAGSRELECLAAGVYFESKSEPLAGQLAVGQVIANRTHSKGRFPASYCGVLTQRGQFSFVRGGQWPSVSKSSRQWQTAVAIARIVDGKLHDDVARSAMFFHAKRVHPGWRTTQVASIGNHIFYR